MASPTAHASFLRRHLLTCEELSASEIGALLDLADRAVEGNRQVIKKRDVLRGRTLINLFFEASTRTQTSFELAGKRLAADVMNMNVATSSLSKGETLIDTAMTLNAMRPDILVVRHHAAGAVEPRGGPAETDIDVLGIGNDEVGRPVAPGADIGKLLVKSAGHVGSMVNIR